MSQFPHDDFIKEYLPELIKDYGVAYSGKKIFCVLINQFSIILLILHPS